MNYKIGILIFDDVDLLDVAGPKEVLSAVKDPLSSQELDPISKLYHSTNLIEIKLVSPDPVEYITTADGTKIIPDESIGSIDTSVFSGWIIPGGKGAQTIRKNNDIISWMKFQLETTKYNLSVCTGAYICAETGLFDDTEITTHYRHFDVFQEMYPNITLNRDKRYIDLESIIFASGVSAGIEGPYI